MVKRESEVTLKAKNLFLRDLIFSGSRSFNEGWSYFLRQP